MCDVLVTTTAAPITTNTPTPPAPPLPNPPPYHHECYAHKCLASSLDKMLAKGRGLLTEKKWNQVLMTLCNHVLFFFQVTVHFYGQDRSVKKWFRVVVVGARVTWICARTVCIISTVLFLELRAMLTVISLLDLPLKSRVCFFVPRLCILHFHRIS